MGPLFGFPVDDSENPPPSRKQATKGVIAGGLIAMFIGMLLVAGSRMMVMSPFSVAVIGVMVIITILTLVGVTVVNLRRSEAEVKRKRGLDGQDMYTLIDRMVDDLDEDELDYLRSRLEQREHGSKRELAESLGDLLDQREEYRESNRR